MQWFRFGGGNTSPNRSDNNGNGSSSNSSNPSSNHGQLTPTSISSPSVTPLVTKDDFFPDDLNTLPFPTRARDIPPPLPSDPEFSKISRELDITRITNRLIVSGLPWKNRSEIGSNRNSIEDLSRFLNVRYGNSYMIFNLVANESYSYDTAFFNHQVVKFDLSKPYFVTLKTLFDICRAIHAWMELDRKNVAVVHCMNGKVRSSLVVASYLRYTDVFDTTLDGM